MFERFSDHARRVLVLAQNEAHTLRHYELGNEDLLIALIQMEDDLPARALAKLGVPLETARGNVKELKIPAAAKAFTGQVPFTDSAKKCLELAMREALQLGHNYIGSEHLLLGIIRHDPDTVRAVYGVYTGDLRQTIIQMMMEQTGLTAPVSAQPTEQLVRSSAEIADEITDLLLRLSKLRAEHDEATRRETGVDPKYVH